MEDHTVSIGIIACSYWDIYILSAGVQSDRYMAHQFQWLASTRIMSQIRFFYIGKIV